MRRRFASATTVRESPRTSKTACSNRLLPPEKTAGRVWVWPSPNPSSRPTAATSFANQNEGMAPLFTCASRRLDPPFSASLSSSAGFRDASTLTGLWPNFIFGAPLTRDRRWDSMNTLHNLFDSLQKLDPGGGKQGLFYSLPALEKAGV